MKSTMPPAEWKKEYEQFLSADASEPPAHLTARILSQVQTDLSTSYWLVAAKTLGIHSVLGTLSLLFCPQFGINPLGWSGLMGVFMQLNPHLCLAACGATFISTSIITCSILLKPEELRILRQTRLLFPFVLGFLSLIVLLLLGGKTETISALAWLAGLVVFGTLLTEAGWLLRTSHVLKT